MKKLFVVIVAIIQVLIHTYAIDTYAEGTGMISPEGFYGEHIKITNGKDGDDQEHLLFKMSKPKHDKSGDRLVSDCEIVNKSEIDIIKTSLFVVAYDDRNEIIGTFQFRWSNVEANGGSKTAKGSINGRFKIRQIDMFPDEVIWRQ